MSLWRILIQPIYCYQLVLWKSFTCLNPALTEKINLNEHVNSSVPFHCKPVFKGYITHGLYQWYLSQLIPKSFSLQGCMVHPSHSVWLIFLLTCAAQRSFNLSIMHPCPSASKFGINT